MNVSGKQIEHSHIIILISLKCARHLRAEWSEKIMKKIYKQTTIGGILRAVVFYGILTILVIVFFPVSVIIAVFASAARGE